MASTDILSGKYPAKKHARKVTDYLKENGYNVKNAIIYLEGQKTHNKEDNDEVGPFRQRRYFYYLSGCELPDSYLAYQVGSDYLTLFIPPIDEDSVIWSGLPLMPKEALEKYDVDNCQTSDFVNDFMERTPEGDVFIISEQRSPHAKLLRFNHTNGTAVKKAIEECRVVKDDYEIALLQKANDVSAVAHKAIVEAAKSAKNECEVEAAFVSKTIACGCHDLAYHPIAASGTNAATLHYVKNDEPLAGRLNLLVDAAAEYSCYCADVTRTFPISGTFSKESKIIYDIVDEMQQSCFGMLKAGVLWESVHEKAHRVAIKGLKAAGILVGDDNEIFEKRVSVAFFPHGLGHYLGMDTHDTGGKANYQDEDPMFRYLRVRGTVPAGSVITVEPGIYFCRFIVDPAIQNPVLGKFIDEKVVENFWEVGGVRIEDDVVITDDGYKNLTTAPKI
ncbi:MAG: hypothetical protein Q9227_006294 [Pyrenula ochraceoflavens]